MGDPARRVAHQKTFMVDAVAASGGLGGEAEELADLGPGEALVAGGRDGLGDHGVGLGEEAGEGVQVDAGVAEALRGAQPGEGLDGVGDDGEAEVVDDRGREVVRSDEPQSGRLAGGGGHETSSFRPARSWANSCWRGSCALAATSSFWACRVGRNAMPVVKRSQLSQIVS
jgi:hypothetical protein